MGLYLLIPLSVVLVFIIGVIFWWSVRSGQYDDMEGPAHRLLLEDRDEPQPDRKGSVKASVKARPGEMESSDVESGSNNSKSIDAKSEK